MKVIQLGCGVTGLVCAEFLAANPKVDELLLADAITDGAERLEKKLADERITVRKTDGGDPYALKELLRDSDVVVCSLPWDLNGRVMETAAELGVNYVDFCLTKEAMDDFDKVDRMCRDAGILATLELAGARVISDTCPM